MKDIKNKTIRTLKAKHLADVLPDGDFDHRKICCNQIEVDKTYLNNLLDAVWEAAYSKGSHDMAELMNEQAADDIQAASEAGYEKAKEQINKVIARNVKWSDANQA
jgi:hypothetical protein